MKQVYSWGEKKKIMRMTPSYHHPYFGDGNINIFSFSRLEKMINPDLRISENRMSVIDREILQLTHRNIQQHVKKPSVM